MDLNNYVTALEAKLKALEDARDVDQLGELCTRLLPVVHSFEDRDPIGCVLCPVDIKKLITRMAQHAYAHQRKKMLAMLFAEFKAAKTSLVAAYAAAAPVDGQPCRSRLFDAGYHLCRFSEALKTFEIEYGPSEAEAQILARLVADADAVRATWSSYNKPVHQGAPQ